MSNTQLLLVGWASRPLVVKAGKMPSPQDWVIYLLEITWLKKLIALSEELAGNKDIHQMISYANIIKCK